MPRRFFNSCFFDYKIEFESLIEEKYMKYWAILLFLITSSQKVDAMSVFDIGKTCVFSEVKVKLMRNGEPLKNTKVIRRWEWNALKQDTATTDSNGYLEFSAIYEKSISRLLPIELVIAQGIYVIENGKEKKSGQIQNVNRKKIRNLMAVL